MAYAGYFVKVGTYTFPKEVILFDTYKGIRSVQDLDAYRDANGVLHRNALEHVIYKVEFQTRPMTNTEYDSIMNSIRAQMTNAQERRANVDMFIPEMGGYSGAVATYIPDPEVTIQQELNSSTLKYDSITFKFISY